MLLSPSTRLTTLSQMGISRGRFRARSLAVRVWPIPSMDLIFFHAGLRPSSLFNFSNSASVSYPRSRSGSRAR